jgi:hypothetical protein
MRQYQLGVVYTDAYGRETPIFSTADSSFKVSKSEANKYNKIITRINTPHPYWAKGIL